MRGAVLSPERERSWGRPGQEPGLWGIVLAGGEGVRLQPFLEALTGRVARKQFCPIGGRPLIRETFARAEYNRAFVLMQYFGYLKREPDQRGYEFWLNVMNSKPANDASAYRSMVCAFLSSTEYQSRFGMIMTHTNSECGP